MSNSRAKGLILGRHFSTLDHHPFSNLLLCLTASSYTAILMHLSQEDFHYLNRDPSS